jgi:ribonucleotide reductase alpha subunit
MKKQPAVGGGDISNRMAETMEVVKRDGRREPVAFEKVQERILRHSDGLSVNPTYIAQQVLIRIVDGIKTSELDEITAKFAESLSTTHPDYGVLAARIAISNHQKCTASTFAEAMEQIAACKDRRGVSANLLAEDFLTLVRGHAELIESKIMYDRDFLFDYFGFKTLEKAYLLQNKIAGKVLERPQHLWMRVAIGIWGSNLKKAFETYELLSTKQYTHATPTLFNAGTKRPQLSSCFLLSMKGDSIKSIYDTLSDCALISQYGGGIGVHAHNIRAAGSLIRGTGGTSNGILPMLRVFNNTARYVDQCFAPDTIIYTMNGPKFIKDVGITDYVLTSDGNYNRVNKPVRHDYKGPILEITITHSISSIHVTPEHPIYTLRGQTKDLNYTVIKNKLDKKIIAPDYIEVKDLSEDDFVGFPIPIYENDIPAITENDCRFYGIMLGNTYVSHDLSEITLPLKEKLSTRKFVEDYLEKNGIKTYTYEDSKSNTVKIKWSSDSTGFKFTKSQLYNSLHIKYIDTPFIHLPIPKIIQIMHGLIETDGCIGPKEIAIEVSSVHLIESIRYMVLRVGALCSGYDCDRVGDLPSTLPTKVLHIPRLPEIMKLFPDAPASESEYFTFMRHGDYIYSRIESIHEKEYEGVLHDFEINSVHDYTVAHLGLAHNGGGKRNGSFAFYLEPWHADVESFLDMKRNTGAEEERARDLFYALWIPDLFMERVDANTEWTLMCPDECPGLADVVGPAFKLLYERYEAEGRGRKTISAQKLWFKILDSQIETGTPYLLYKDACNLKSNQQNLGTIKSSNLCVAPETRVLTSMGEIPIKLLCGQTVNVWNGDTWSSTTIQKTNDDAELWTIVVSDTEVNNADGSSWRTTKQIVCTPYHKFVLENEYRIAAHDLKIGDELRSWIDDKLIEHIVHVQSIHNLGRRDVTYCFNEPINHMGVFNGILTGNCSEIVEYSSPEETAVCNLASLNLPAYVEGAVFQFKRFRSVVKQVVESLNQVIDINYYPIPEAKLSNMRHRPIGIGVQGLADVFAMLRISWESPEAAALNKKIFAHMYYAAVESSMDCALRDGVYETYAGSPASKGKLQFALWGQEPLADSDLDWDYLYHMMEKIGLRNSLLIAPMPTASTAQLLGNTESIEPVQQNLFTRRTLAGEFFVVNRHLIRLLCERGLWTPELKEKILIRNGSVQGLAEIPADVQALFKTVWEIKQKTLIDLAADRAPYICQSQSLNLFISDPTYAKLTSMHFYAWRKGLKTGIYYLRTRAAVGAQQFTVAPTAAASAAPTPVKEEKECLLCSS